MIFLFSGTGNSQYIAYELGYKLNEPIHSIDEHSGCDIVFEGSNLGFVFPVYSWGVPPQVLTFIKTLPDSVISASKGKAWMVCTCGDEVAMTPEMLASALKLRGIELLGRWSIIMPNNYVLLPGFDVDNKDVELKKLKEAPDRIEQISKKILAGDWEFDFVRGNWPKLKTRLIYPLFVRFGISSKKWRSLDDCIGCGKCATICPMHNIKLIQRRPEWNDNCASCCGCFHICPVNAVQYGNITKGKGQYFNPVNTF
ncbi:MAG: EFR1 family ferrodoxin [Prevotella sp.]|nr:EFR1 family ferrodoxin [Bacteroides sp.]MCM1365672.1 EFR1 family ferrodoxin [Prevotella sp.]